MTKFNQSIPSLKSTLINARKIDAKEINLNGKNIESLKGLNLPQDYPKLISRVRIPEGALFELYDDWGNMVYTNCSDRIVDGTERYVDNNFITFEWPLDNLEIGDRMFKNCRNLSTFVSEMPKLRSGKYMFDMAIRVDDDDDRKGGDMKIFKSDTSSLENGSYMFYGSGLVSFKGSLKSLTNGENMFVGCRLDEESFHHIINELKNNISTTPFELYTSQIPSSISTRSVTNKNGIQCEIVPIEYM